MLSKNIFNFSNLQYDILSSGYAILGNKTDHPEVDFDWNCNENNQFLNWESNRIWHVTKGTASVETTFGRIELNEKCTYFIPKGTIISTFCDDYMEQYFIDFLCYSDLLPFENMFSFNHCQKSNDFLPLLIKNIVELKNDMSVINEFKKTTIMTTIISQFIKQPIISHSKMSPFVETIKYINEHINTEIKITDLAKIVGYNAEYFSRSFKSIFNMTPQIYIMQKRLLTAKHLLVTTDFPISHIATTCGYQDPLSFTKAFTKHIKVSPTQYRLFYKLNK